MVVDKLSNLNPTKSPAWTNGMATFSTKEISPAY